MKKIFYIFVFCLGSFSTYAQQSFITGVVKDLEKNPIQAVSISYLNKGTITDANGEYKLEIPANESVTIKFEFLGYQTIYKNFKGVKNKNIHYNPILLTVAEILNTVEIKNYQNQQEGITQLKTDKFKRIPGANAGIENLLMTQPGVNNNNELSTQYNVRGGSFDENLVYVNGIEIYRPFLVRSGQQEGLSFLNPQMTENLQFSAGGFESKYGDKLSSVLNIFYKKPKETLHTINTNLLGGNYTFENLSKNKKLTTLVSTRYRNNQLLLNNLNTESTTRPVFSDVQTYLTYQINTKNSIEFLGNLAANQYYFKPYETITKFGGIFQPRELIVYYDGNEKDQYQTYFGALTYKHSQNKNNYQHVTFSSFLTQEQEYYDIQGDYTLAELDPITGNQLFVTGVGSQLSHARNDLDVLIANLNYIQHFEKNNHQFEIGFKAQTENIRDRINEWQFVDDNGLTLRDPNLNISLNEPDVIFNAPITPFYQVKALNNINIHRITGYAQWNQKWSINNHLFWHHLGARSQSWQITNGNLHSTFSPRFRLSMKPDWKNKDMVFRFATGYYHQSPSFKEIRNQVGVVNPNVKAQQAIHYTLANEYSFTKWKRPFKLTTELYYKDLQNINSYTLDNVRIRYLATNNSIGYATGIDFQVNGEFVPGSDSWISFGLLKTAENINNRGYLPRPTDQRFKFAMLFQDFVPSIPDVKVYLNMVVNGPLPSGSPINASATEGATVDLYDFTSRLRPYRRADVGFNYIIVDKAKIYKTGLLSHFKNLEAGMEIYNVFNIENTASTTWIYDVANQYYNSVPNTLTGRILNFKLSMQF